MIVFPAIDMFQNKAVRLLHGDYAKMTVYGEDTLSLAKEFEQCGAGAVHLVDLEGAKFGTTLNFNSIVEIAKKTSLFTEVGGGIRDLETIEKYLSQGISRVILGTASVQNPDFMKKAVDVYGKRIAIGADIKDGMIAIKGWTEKSALTADEFFSNLEKIGVDTVICTDISKDGAMKGTNFDLYKALSAKYNLNITASGGVSSLEDVVRLRKLNLYGAIIGRAYYEGAIDLRRAVEASK